MLAIEELGWEVSSCSGSLDEPASKLGRRYVLRATDAAGLAALVKTALVKTIKL